MQVSRRYNARFSAYQPKSGQRVASAVGESAIAIGACGRVMVWCRRFFAILAAQVPSLLHIVATDGEVGILDNLHLPPKRSLGAAERHFPEVTREVIDAGQASRCVRQFA
jgi:hypothetical protein